MQYDNDIHLGTKSVCARERDQSKHPVVIAEHAITTYWKIQLINACMNVLRALFLRDRDIFRSLFSQSKIRTELTPPNT